MGDGEMVRITCIIPTRDGEATLPSTLDSLRRQTIPINIVVIDDCSIDSTRRILRTFKVSWVGYPKRGRRDYARIPKLLNLGLKLARESDYYLISGDDCTYPQDYIEKIISSMVKDGIDCASGYHDRPLKSPSGSGRVFTARLWRILTPFPVDISWETGCLFKAEMAGLRCAAYLVKYNHEKAYGVSTTRTFGYGLYVLGYPFIYALGKTIIDIAKRRHTIFNSLAIFVGYIEYRLRGVRRSDIAPYVSSSQRRKMNGFVRRMSLK